MNLPVSQGKEAKALAELVDGMLRQMGVSTEPVPSRKNLAIRTSLFDRCIELCRSGTALAPDAKVRTLHHLSCTGGTLIAKCLASMPNTLVLNEVDPFSKMLYQPDSPQFTPTDFASLVRMGDPSASDDILAELFRGQLRTLQTRVIAEGRRLVLRDHSHGQFLFFGEPDPKQSLLAVVDAEFPTCSVVTVRNPFDSFLSMLDLGWIVFSPSTLDEYCRRYHLFLDAHAGLEIVRYEDFLADAQPVMRRICAILELPFNEMFEMTFDAFRFSGDSGRRDGVIAPRPRRKYPAELEKEASTSIHYARLCQRLGYRPVKGAPVARKKGATARARAKKQSS